MGEAVAPPVAAEDLQVAGEDRLDGAAAVPVPIHVQAVVAEQEEAAPGREQRPEPGWKRTTKLHRRARDWMTKTELR